ncbi:hypothetical protein AMATHDRAFT_51154 [Amanita thiersii Skay4041]|uniref:Uncharacterized protein n=1 Tax=Amanita thiersii Skay4041 TaxID=703135 RepID=A0A2A9NEY2_9AGAR|nr:hypothetical protein AMATHDRAFT_51154 [Amanita thiersii Skay4041]
MLKIRTSQAPVESMIVILADCILIYRCWVTYAYKWKVVVLPIFLWVAYIVFSVLFLYTSTYQLMHETPITLTINRLYKVSIGACFICTIGINSYATSFIIFRIWNLANRTTEPPDRRNLTLTIRIIAESGLLYTITSILALITGVAYLELKNTSSSIASSIFAAINLNMTGIAFNLLLIRVALNRTSASTSSSLRQSIPMFNLEHDDSNTSQERIPDSTDDPMKARAPADANV